MLLVGLDDSLNYCDDKGFTMNLIHVNSVVGFQEMRFSMQSELKTEEVRGTDQLTRIGSAGHHSSSGQNQTQEPHGWKQVLDSGTV